MYLTQLTLWLKAKKKCPKMRQPRPIRRYSDCNPSWPACLIYMTAIVSASNERKTSTLHWSGRPLANLRRHPSSYFGRAIGFDAASRTEPDSRDCWRKSCTLCCVLYASRICVWWHGVTRAFSKTAGHSSRNRWLDSGILAHILVFLVWSGSFRTSLTRSVRAKNLPPTRTRSSRFSRRDVFTRSR